MARVRLQLARIDCLPVELSLLILDNLPDIKSLVSAAYAVPSLYRTLLSVDSSISTRILRRELPDHLWTHATVAYLAQQWGSGGRDFDSLEPGSDIDTLVDSFRSLRDNAPAYRVTHLDAVAILRTYDKVVALRDHFEHDCPNACSQQLIPLRDSLRRNPPQRSEQERIERAIYLFDIMSSFCKNMVLTRPRDATYISESYEKVSALQKALVDRLMAPWELYQVMHIQAYFRRALHGLDRGQHLSERVMPGMLVGGVDFVHHALRVVDKAALTDFIAPLERRLLRQPQNIFGVLISRGIYQTWTRASAKAFDHYRPFCRDGDRLGFNSWRSLETMYQRFTLGNDPNILDLFHDWVAAKEGRIDLWAASLWNEDRWDDIEMSIHSPRAELWKGIRHHWDAMAVGFQVLANPGVLVNEGKETSACE